jgi:hypothetical protein
MAGEQALDGFEEGRRVGAKTASGGGALLPGQFEDREEDLLRACPFLRGQV